MTLLVIAVGGQYFARHVSSEAALRWSRGEFLQTVGGHQQPGAKAFAARSARRAATRTGNEKV